LELTNDVFGLRNGKRKTQKGRSSSIIWTGMSKSESTSNHTDNRTIRTL